MTNLLYGVDVSHYNDINDANAMHNNGITFAWCKATQGTSYVDPTFTAKVAQLKAAGIIVGAYHYMDDSDTAQQAAHFKQVAATVLGPGNLVPMLDMEDSSVRSNANVAVEQFYDALGVAPMDVYGNLDWWLNVLKPNQWGNRNILPHIARYNGDPGNPGTTVAQFKFHQHSNRGIVAGVPNFVDRDCTMPGVTLEQIVIAGQTPKPKPAPRPAGLLPRNTILRRGDKGSAVRTLQQRLNRDYPLYSHLVVDGDFGPKTESVVKEFQRRSHLVVDGIAGPKTLGALRLI